MRTVICACFVLLTFACGVRAQSTKPWIEWTRKDVEKTLNDSACGQTQTEGGQHQPETTSAFTATTAARRDDSNISAASKAESAKSNLQLQSNIMCGFSRLNQYERHLL